MNTRGRAAAMVAALAMATISSAAAAGGETPSQRGHGLPKMTQPDATHHARTATRGEFGSAFDYASSKKVGCGQRLSRVRVRCKVKFGAGDTSYDGHVVVYFRWKRGEVWWFTKGDFKVVDEYCIYALDKPKSQCTDSRGWG